jgi:hypothetical protein
VADDIVRVALYVLGTIGVLFVICIGVWIAVLPDPKIAALAVLASIATAAVGGVAGMVTPRQQGAPGAHAWHGAVVASPVGRRSAGWIKKDGLAGDLPTENPPWPRANKSSKPYGPKVNNPWTRS